MSAGAFSPRAALLLALATLALLLGLGWAVGAGYADGDINDGGGHAGGVGLNGYAGLYRLLGSAGYTLATARDEASFGNVNGQKGAMLVLTPAMGSEPKEIDRIVSAHRHYGPVLVIQPKWAALPANTNQPGAKRGWTTVFGANGAQWPGFRDDVTWQIKPLPGGVAMMPGYGGAPGQAEAGGRAGVVHLARPHSGLVCARRAHRD